jgi:2-polyprenyl-3-methyl-5-hydroxy-6-metoxy-1,4-benzoquinol methylase
MAKKALKDRETRMYVTERMDLEKTNPNTRDFLYQEHIARYDFASQFVKDKTVLDVACGTAYGTVFLSDKRLKMVVGTDLSKEALNEAKENFGNIVNFLVSDATDMSFKEGAFDVVISFETIEHLMKYEDFVSEIKRILTDEGLFIVSTPNKLAFSGKDKMYFNEYHFKEFTLAEFCLLLGKYFSDIQFFGEGKMNTKYNILRDIRKVLVKKTRFDILKLYKLGIERIFNKLLRPADVYPLQTKEYLEPKYIIAVCKNRSMGGN